MTPSTTPTSSPSKPASKPTWTRPRYFVCIRVDDDEVSLSAFIYNSKYNPMPFHVGNHSYLLRLGPYPTLRLANQVKSLLRFPSPQVTLESK